MLKNLVAMAMMASVAIAPSQVFAATPEPVSQDVTSVAGVYLLDDFSVTADSSSVGFNVVLRRNEDGTFSQTVTDISEPVAIPYASVEGSLDWALFHLEFEDWENSRGDLKYFVAADEPLMHIYADEVFLEIANRLLDKDDRTLYRESIDEPVNGLTRLTMPLAYNVNTRNESVLYMGFKNVSIRTIYGETGSFVNVSQNIYEGT